MPIAVVSDFKDTDLDQYDKVIEALGYTPGGPGADGLLFHWATKTPDGLRTVDIWQDRETADAHAQAEIGPAAAAAGITAEPRVAYIDVHNYLTA
jgi:hypothetical protein